MTIPCLCPSCAKEPAETYSEQFRHETEVRFVAQHDAEWIAQYLDVVKVKRGEAAWMKLREDVRKEWKRNK